MPKSGTRGRRFWLAVAVAAIGLMTYAAFALAADSITATDDVYNAPTYTMNQGERPNFTNAGALQHNVTAQASGPDKRALFSTPTLNGGQQALVDGTQYLTAGTYTFFCTIHPTQMQATLVVTASGTPQARPSVTLKGKKTSVAKAVKKGILVNIDASTKIDGAALTVKLGKATVGKATLSLAAGPQTDRIKLNKAGKSKLRHKSKAKLGVSANIPFGFPASGKVKLG